MKQLVPVALALFLMGQNCEPPTPPEDVNPYCHGIDETEPGVLDAVMDGIGGIWNTIIGGTPSVDRRATVLVYIGSGGRCSGVIIGSRTVLTAAHCRSGDGTHRICLDTTCSPQFLSTRYLEHPDYQQWRSAGDLEARKSDIMLLFFETDLPGPYTNGAYNSNPITAAECSSLTAQGWGKNEDNTIDLRESDYTVTAELDKVLKTKQLTWGGICFGDSGGPLYAELEDESGWYVAGITSTTASTDCLVSSTHIKVSAFEHWIMSNMGGGA